MAFPSSIKICFCYIIGRSRWLIDKACLKMGPHAMWMERVEEEAEKELIILVWKVSILYNWSYQSIYIKSNSAFSSISGWWVALDISKEYFSIKGYLPQEINEINGCKCIQSAKSTLWILHSENISSALPPIEWITIPLYTTMVFYYNISLLLMLGGGGGGGGGKCQRNH